MILSTIFTASFIFFKDDQALLMFVFQILAIVISNKILKERAGAITGI